MQRVTLIGFVGSDPEMRYTPDGTAVTNVSLATKEFVGKEGFSGPRDCPNGWVESYNGKGWEVTTWWRLTFWRNRAEAIAQYVSKGDKMYVEGIMQGDVSEGKMNPRVWAGQDGVSRASFELNVQKFEFMKREGGSKAPVGEAPPEEFGETEALPF